MNTKNSGALRHYDRRLDQIFHDASAGMRNRALVAACKCGIFQGLGDQTMTPRALARKLKFYARPTEELLRVLAGLGYVVEQNGENGHDLTVFSNSPIAKEYLAGKGPIDLCDGVIFWGSSVELWDRIPEILRTGKPIMGKMKWTIEKQWLFDKGVSSVTSAIARAFAQVCAPELSQCKSALDAGGGPGLFVRFILEQNPDMTATLFDLPHVIDFARERWKEADLLPLAPRVTFTPGDFWRKIPTGHPIIIASNIAHHFYGKRAVRLFKRFRKAVHKGARIAVVDYYSELAVLSKLLGMEFYITSGNEGTSHTTSTVKSWLSKAGWRVDDETGVRGLTSFAGVVIGEAV